MASFGRILRDHNHRRRESSIVSKSLNLQEQVRDRITIDSGASADENWSPLHHRIDNNDNHNHRLRLTKSKHARPAAEEEKEEEEEGEEPTMTAVMSPRQSRILDRWVARQARDMNITMERQRNEAELLALSGSQSVSARTSTFMRETSPFSETSSSSSSAAASEIPNLRASTLVRRWKDFEAVARLNHCHSVESEPGKPAHPNIEKEEEQQQPRPSSTTMDDSFTDWESDRASSPPGAAAATGGEGGDSERVRVADIIRRLTAADQAGDSLGSWSCWSEDTVTEEHEADSERSSFSQATSNSPRVRGRQAFNDLLMLIERDRQGELDLLAELRPVSRFTQKGRIQSMLRLRLLHRGIGPQEQSATLRSTGSRDRLRQRSIIRLLREKFSIGPAAKTDLRVRSPPEEEFPMQRKLEMEESVPSDPVRLGEDVRRLEIRNAFELRPQLNIPSVQPLVTCSLAEDDICEGADAPTADDATWQAESSFNISSIDPRECPETHVPCQSVWGESLIAQEQQQQDIYSNDGRHMGVSDYNWLSDISSPREYWEDLRQERYREMLDTSKNEDIRRLLERKRVSSFLTSDLRDQMDQLLGSFLQRRTCHEGGKEIGADEERKVDDEKGQGGEVEESQIEEEMRGRYFDEGVHQSTMRGQNHDVSNYFGRQSPSSQTPLPTLMGQPWNNYHSNEVGTNGSYQMVTASPHPPRLHHQFHTRDNVQNHCGPEHHPSIEMELMYDLRRHIEKLHYEMSELQNSLKSCMEMQAHLQYCMKSSDLGICAPASSVPMSCNGVARNNWR